jgi:UDP-3-O-[3-hydroxymyristoyl] N-acetylglucosamine deacetylase
LLSVFYSMGVDNAYIEIGNLEVPILEGSGSPYMELLPAAGLKSYRRRKGSLRIRRPVTVEAGSKRISILPSDRLLLTCDVSYDHPRLDGGDRNAMRRRRTFGFEHELDQMRNMGLIRGAALNNAICFHRQGG